MKAFKKVLRIDDAIPYPHPVVETAIAILVGRPTSVEYGPKFATVVGDIQMHLPIGDVYASNRMVCERALAELLYAADGAEFFGVTVKYVPLPNRLFKLEYWETKL